jgi:hypothetical protein
MSVARANGPVPDVSARCIIMTLVVSDVRAAVDFYTTKLGFWCLHGR